MSPMRTVVSIVIAACVADCGAERAQIANYAQNKMVGLTKDQVLACMGTPASKATEGATEVWSYPSGNCTVNVTMMEGKVKRMTMLVQPAARYPKTSNVSSPSRTARIEQFPCKASQPKRKGTACSWVTSWFDVSCVGSTGPTTECTPSCTCPLCAKSGHWTMWLGEVNKGYSVARTRHAEAPHQRRMTQAKSVRRASILRCGCVDRT